MGPDDIAVENKTFPAVQPHKATYTTVVNHWKHSNPSPTLIYEEGNMILAIEVSKKRKPMISSLTSRTNTIWIREMMSSHSFSTEEILSRVIEGSEVDSNVMC